jgi:hypothetical protein
MSPPLPPPAAAAVVGLSAIFSSAIVVMCVLRCSYRAAQRLSRRRGAAACARVRVFNRARARSQALTVCSSAWVVLRVCVRRFFWPRSRHKLWLSGEERHAKSVKSDKVSFSAKALENTTAHAQTHAHALAAPFAAQTHAHKRAAAPMLLLLACCNAHATCKLGIAARDSCHASRARVPFAHTPTQRGEGEAYLIWRQRCHPAQAKCAQNACVLLFLKVAWLLL